MRPTNFDKESQRIFSFPKPVNILDWSLFYAKLKSQAADNAEILFAISTECRQIAGN